MQGVAITESFRPLRWLFLPQSRGSLGETIAWWELRRIPYNLIVGCFALICLFIFYQAIDYAGHLEPGEDAVEPMMLFIGPILMNICYTGGWFIEVIGRMSGLIHSLRFSPMLLKFGFGFSLFVVSLPAVIWIGVCIFRAIT